MSLQDPELSWAELGGIAPMSSAMIFADRCPPTFGSSPHLVQGLIAGGHGALLKAVEGAEDSTAGGRADMSGSGACPLLDGAVSGADVVVGIAASGRTPYVWGALAEAKRVGATTALLCFNPVRLCACWPRCARADGAWGVRSAGGAGGAQDGGRRGRTARPRDGH